MNDSKCPYKMDLGDFKIREIKEFHDKLKGLSEEERDKQIDVFARCHGLTKIEAEMIANCKINGFHL